MSDKTGIENWRKRIGEKEANKITARSADRGTQMHDMCEQYLLNNSVDGCKQTWLSRSLFNQLKPELDNNVDNIRALETQLYSKKLRAAGTVDCIGNWKGVPSIIDFKTSRSRKKLEYIDGYFIQASFYSYMLYELTGLKYHNIVILMAIDDENYPQVFECNVSNWIFKVKEMSLQFHKA